jgi:hypothetical protein
MFAGCAEAAAGLLLLLPQTALLGALLAAADMTQVFMLNMTYDVPLKLMSFHLLLISLFLIAPESPRLARFFLGNETVGPSRETPLFRTARANRIALWLQIAFAVWLLAINVVSAVHLWNMQSKGRTRSPLFGAWTVQTMMIDGIERAPLLTDPDRWRRLIFDYDTAMRVQTIDGELHRSGLKLDAVKRTFDLSRDSDPTQTAHFVYDRKAPDAMTLDGDMNGHPVHMELAREDEKKLLLESRGFHWVQDYPFNR